jgi:hypothetical protein
LKGVGLELCFNGTPNRVFANFFHVNETTLKHFRKRLQTKRFKMTTYIQTLRNKSIRQTQMKLSKHRELGNKSTMSIFEVANLMDKLKSFDTLEASSGSIFFDVSLN